MTDAGQAVEQAHRTHWSRLLALLARELRSIDLAEEVLQDSYATAVTTWRRDGVPRNPPAWLLTTARRRALDRRRRETTLARRLPLLVTDDVDDPRALPDDEVTGVTTIPDERLRLLFTCCHPTLAPEARVALTARLLGGLTTPEVARLFLVAEPTMAARITRAKKKIAGAGIPYRVPSDAELPERLPAVLTVLYLVFTEGYAATQGDRLIRAELCDDAIRLTRILVGQAPDEPEPAALLALMLLHHSRRDARIDAGGEVVLLRDQDRSRWNATEIAEGLALTERSLRMSRVAGHYALQAAIAAEHVSAGADGPDWAAIAALYALLDERTGSPIVRLNRAVAVAESDGAEAGLALLAGLDDRLGRHHLLYSTRAELLGRLGRRDEAVAQYDLALAAVVPEAERRFLRKRRAEVAAPP
ncbi:MAG: RNA polymerase subunit sigma-24 [Streptosporangiales bacterium]|nr:RNA polymerase subunit sigma-24 [Streptosporangiales bacterium]